MRYKKIGVCKCSDLEEIRSVLSEINSSWSNLFSGCFIHNESGEKFKLCGWNMTGDEWRQIEPLTKLVKWYDAKTYTLQLVLKVENITHER